MVQHPLLALDTSLSFQQTAQMSQSSGSKFFLTGTSRVSYGSSKQIPEACLKAKSPQAPELLTPPCH